MRYHDDYQTGLEAEPVIFAADWNGHPRGIRWAVHAIIGTILGGGFFVIVLAIGGMGVALLRNGLSISAEDAGGALMVLFLGPFFGAVAAAVCTLPCLLIVSIGHQLLGRPLSGWYSASLVGGLTGSTAVSLLFSESLLLSDGLNFESLFFQGLATLCGQLIAGCWVARVDANALDWRRRLRWKDSPEEDRKTISWSRNQQANRNQIVRRPVRFAFNIRGLMWLTTTVAILSAIARYAEVPPSKMLGPVLLCAIGQLIMVPLFAGILQLKQWQHDEPQPEPDK